MKSALLIGVVSPAAIRENDVEKNILNAETDFTWDLQNVIFYKRKLNKKILCFFNIFYIFIYFSELWPSTHQYQVSESTKES